MDSRTVIRRLAANGRRLDRITGSHHQFKHPERSGTVTVPHPRKDLPRSLIASIEKQSGSKIRTQ